MISVHQGSAHTMGVFSSRAFLRRMSKGKSASWKTANEAQGDTGGIHRLHFDLAIAARGCAPGDRNSVLSLDW